MAGNWSAIGRQMAGNWSNGNDSRFLAVYFSIPHKKSDCIKGQTFGAISAQKPYVSLSGFLYRCIMKL
jgi:hypothetical protein